MTTDALLAPVFERASDPLFARSHRDRLRLAVSPTPLQRLDRLRDALGGGPRLWIKRDDLTGLALGGNKARKLEYLVAQALAEGADTLVTVGAVQSNHARQTAAAAAAAGIGSLLVLRVAPGLPAERLGSGNALLDRLLGADIELVDETPDDPHPERAAAAAAIARLREEGRRPFLIPSGGSTAIGALGYVAAYAEIVQAGVPFDEIVVANGSGGTQAGLIAGRELLPAPARPRIRGVAVAPGSHELAARVDGLVTELLTGFGHRSRAHDLAAQVDPGYVGPAYGALTSPAAEAIGLFARSEGILLDPVYTAKAAAALIADVRRGAHPEDSDVLFLHTGGSPALFAYRGELTGGDAHTEEGPRP